MEADEIRKRFT
jgi:hypothetical protein